jgi:hypothetical protein
METPGYLGRRSSLGLMKVGQISEKRWLDWRLSERLAEVHDDSGGERVQGGAEVRHSRGVTAESALQVLDL